MKTLLFLVFQNIIIYAILSSNKNHIKKCKLTLSRSFYTGFNDI